MKRYIKFRNGVAAEAPASIVKNGMTILGYNKSSNEEMLLEDGYMIYEGTRDLSELRLVDGQIVEITPSTPIVQNTLFTKLQIRRAMRKLGLEPQLDALLEGDAVAKRDWEDAQIIDLNDAVFQKALYEAGWGEEFIETIVAAIESAQ